MYKKNPAIMPFGIFFLFENTVDPDQLASDKAIGSGYTLFFILIENACNWNAAG